MHISNSSNQDIETIFELYKIASDYQKTKKSVVWPEFDRKLVEIEIEESRQWKMVINNQIACVWAITFDDPEIWEERNIDPSVYIHRITTNPDFRGQNFVVEIVKWAKKFGQLINKNFIRLDTVGENKGLISHYEKCGFDFLGLKKLKMTQGLPKHYENASVSLFEIKI